MMFTFAYPAIFKRDEDGRVVVSFPDFPNAHTDGADANKAMEEAIDCLGSSIAFVIADKAAVPKPSRPKRGQKLVPVPFWIVGKLALHWAIHEIGISQSELARRLKVRETVVRRMLDPNHDTRPEKIQAALQTLGRRVVMAYYDAA
jgi:antitoxin HicB